MGTQKRRAKRRSGKGARLPWELPEVVRQTAHCLRRSACMSYKGAELADEQITQRRLPRVGGISMAESFIDGGYAEFSRLDRMTIVDPSNGEEVDTVPSSGTEEVDQAVRSAYEAFPAWRGTPAAKRGELLGEAAQAVLASRAELAPLLTSEQGKPLREANLEIRRFVHTLEHYVGLARNIRGGYVPDLDEDTYGLIVRRP